MAISFPGKQKVTGAALLALKPTLLSEELQTHRTAERHDENRKRRINIHQGREDEGVIRWLSESNRNSDNSIVYRQKGSHAKTREARERGEEKVSEQTTLRQKSSPKTLSTR